MKRVLSTSLFLAISLLLLAKPALGQVTLSIWPPILEVMIQPGKSFTQAYEITNESGTDLYLRPIIVPFKPSDLNGNISLELDQPSNRYFSLTNNQITLNQTFKLSANSRQQLVLRIAIPKTEPDQDHYFTFLIEQSAEGKFAGNTGGESSIELGSNILLTISQSGISEKQASISRFFPQPKIADLWQKINFEVLIQNTGQSFFKTVGEIEINHRLLKKKTTKLELRPDNILANSGRKIICQNQSSFSSLLPGPYQAKLSFSPDGVGEKQEAVTTFWILPIKSSLVIIVLLLILILVKFRYKKGLDN